MYSGIVHCVGKYFSCIFFLYLLTSISVLMVMKTSKDNHQVTIPSLQTHRLTSSHFSSTILALPNPCKQMVAFGIISSPSQKTRRMAIRNTWAQWSGRNVTWREEGRKVSKNMKKFLEKKKLYKEEEEHRSYSVRTFFIVGRVKSEEEMMALKEEAKEYGDILITNNKEGYSNLPLKTMAMMDYFINHCHNASYLVKMDDDVFLSVPLLARTLDRLQSANISLGGRLTTMESPDRTAGYKYFVSEQQYSGKHYPPFLSGIYTPYLAMSLQSLYQVLAT